MFSLLKWLSVKGVAIHSNTITDFGKDCHPMSSHFQITGGMVRENKKYLPPMARTLLDCQRGSDCFKTNPDMTTTNLSALHLSRKWQ